MKVYIIYAPPEHPKGIVHKTFLEYFAAREIYENRIEQEPAIFENAENREWREVILLYAGIMGEPADMIARLIRKGRIELAAECFVNAGVPFPQGTSITYNKSISQLIVSNTPENLEVFERILSQLNVIPKQVEIEARFVEVAQNALKVGAKRGVWSQSRAVKQHDGFGGFDLKSEEDAHLRGY